MPMPVNRLPRRATAAAAIALALAACGGGDFGEEQADPERTLGDASAARAHAMSAASEEWIDEKHLIVQITDGNIQAIAANVGGQVKDQLDQRPIYLLSAADPAKALAVLQQQENVVFAEPNRPTYAPEYEPKYGAIMNSVIAIETKDACDRAVPLSEPWAERQFKLDGSKTRGLGVKVAVLDTGIDLVHPALASKLIAGRDFVGGDADASEEGVAGCAGAYGHGTHVAGIIAKVAPDAGIMPVRVLDANGKGSLWTVAKGVVWAIDPDKLSHTDDGAAVLNLSLGSIDASTVLKRVIQIAGCSPELVSSDRDFVHSGFTADRNRCGRQLDAVVFAGAGNDAKQPSLYPAAFLLKGLGSVTASNEQHKLASFAAQDAHVQMAAPGDHITSTYPGGFATMSGTSMATPWAAGTAALVLSSLPPWGNGSLPKLRQWGNVAVLDRMKSSTSALCDSKSIKQIDPVAAANDTKPVPLVCP
jgi:subtilisin family serine protease